MAGTPWRKDAGLSDDQDINAFLMKDGDTWSAPEEKVQFD